MGGGPDRTQDPVRGPETVAAVILEPVQNSGGAFTPQEGYFERVREICDRHGVLLISDEVICSWGRLGHYFGCRPLRLSAGPDHDREGPHLGVRADGRGDRLRPDRRAIHARTSGCSPTGITFGGHPVSAAVALANLDIFEREDLCGHVRAKEAELRQMLNEAPRGPADRRGRARNGLLPCARARQGQGDEGELRRRRGRGPVARLHVGRALPPRLICRADDRGTR